MTAPTSASSAPTASAGTATVWRPEGRLVIDTIAGWHHEFTERLTTAVELTIDLGGLTDVDAFGLQLLLSASRSAAARRQRLTLTGIPAVVDEACRTAGLDRSSFSAQQP